MTQRKKIVPLEPLEAIRRLMILQLLAQGVKTESIAEILEIDTSTIRHMISVKGIISK